MVTKGLRVGVWAKWVEMADYVIGVHHNGYQSFRSRADALRSYHDAKEDGKVQVLAK